MKTNETQNTPVSPSTSPISEPVNQSAVSRGIKFTKGFNPKGFCDFQGLRLERVMAVREEDKKPEVPIIEASSEQVTVNLHPLQERALGGAIMGGVSAVAMQPINNYLVLKRANKGMSSTEVVKELNNRGLKNGWYIGTGSAITKAQFSSVVQFIAKSVVEERLEKVTDNETIIEAGSGIVAGMCQAVVMNPVSAVETRRVLDTKKTTAVLLDVFSGAPEPKQNVVKGISFLYRGTTTATTRNGIWGGVYYGLRHQLNDLAVRVKESELIEKGIKPEEINREQLALSGQERMIVSGVSGLVATVAATPIEVINVVQKADNVGIIEATKRVAFTNGVFTPKNFFRGLEASSPRMIFVGIMLSKSEEAARLAMQALGSAKE